MHRICMDAALYTSASGKKNENLWESLRGIMVNGALWKSLKYSMYSLGRILKAPFRIFYRPTLGHILGQTEGQKPSGPAAPGFWPLLWPLMWPQLPLLKIPWGTFIGLPREYIEYSREPSLGPPFTMLLPRIYHRLFHI